MRAELNSLARPVAETVARHLVAVGRLIDEDPDEAYAHALAARRLAQRIAAVREAAGLAAYHVGEWQVAVAELRTYHRLAGTQAHLAVIADAERALGRPDRAIDLYRATDVTKLEPATAIELLIVAAGARADLGQPAAAVAMLQVPELGATVAEPWVARLRYAYADALLAVGRRAEAREWFARAAAVDEDLTTDAAERLLDLDGVLIEEAGGDEGDNDDEAGGDAAADQSGEAVDIADRVDSIDRIGSADTADTADTAARTVDESGDEPVGRRGDETVDRPGDAAGEDASGDRRGEGT